MSRLKTKNARPAQVCLLALVALVLLRGGSCLRVTRPYPPPTVKQLVAALERRAARVRTVRAETRMGHQTAQGKVRATVRLMAAAGGKLRFDAVSPMDTPLSTLVASDGQFSLTDAKANRHYHGPATPCNLARLMGVELSPDAVLAVLGGSTPLIDHRGGELRWDEQAGEEVLILRGARREQRIHLDGRLAGGKPRWDLLRSEIRDDKGRVLLLIEARGYRRVGGLRVPRELAVTQPKIGNALDVVFKKEELNVELPAAAFERPGPGGLPSERVDCASPAAGE